jgi:histidinol-phosphatase (PHP family)
MIPHDYHTHSNFSADCRFAMPDMCLSAIEKGISEIGFTEHFDLHPDDTTRDWFRLEPWVAELERCRSVFAGQLIIRAGIELGEPHLFQEGTREILSQYPFDYALGSLHWVGRESVFDRTSFQRPADEAFRLYFEELARMADAGGFEILSHFDVPVRTAFEVYGEYDACRYEEPARAVLAKCIERGIAVEINSAALRRPANVLNPGPHILRWYAEMGGEMLTLGSDAHRPEHLAADLDVAVQAARDAGFKYVTRFEQRKGQQVPL